MRGDVALFVVVFVAIIVPLLFVSPEDKFLSSGPQLEEPASDTAGGSGALLAGIVVCIIFASGLALSIFRRQVMKMNLSAKDAIPPLESFFSASRKLKRTRQEVHSDLVRRGMSKQQADKALYYYRPIHE